MVLTEELRIVGGAVTGHIRRVVPMSSSHSGLRLQTLTILTCGHILYRVIVSDKQKFLVFCECSLVVPMNRNELLDNNN